MSDLSGGPGWWLASDGRWYPPESHPAIQPAASGYSPPGYPPQAPQWPQAPAPSPYGPQFFQGAPVVVARQTNGLAIASMVISFFGIIPFLFGLPCLLGIIFGFVALGQIKRTGGVQGGRAVALAGIIVSFALVAIFLVVVLAALPVRVGR